VDSQSLRSRRSRTQDRPLVTGPQMSTADFRGRYVDAVFCYDMQSDFTIFRQPQVRFAFVPHGDPGKRLDRLDLTTFGCIILKF
jgi:hypothetical protein